jgi:hypothetical protein
MIIQLNHHHQYHRRRRCRCRCDRTIPAMSLLSTESYNRTQEYSPRYHIPLHYHHYQHRFFYLRNQEDQVFVFVSRIRLLQQKATRKVLQHQHQHQQL